MPSGEYNPSDPQFIDETLQQIHQVFDSVAKELKESGAQSVLSRLKKQFVPGKMLRTRLGMALNCIGFASREEMVKSCAATELIHSATLFHDDVIDGASLRRRNPTLWREVGATGAILMGDLFFSSALQLVIESGNLSRVASFVGKVREVCATEVIHELVFRDKEIDLELCLKVARGKTGPLFAFVTEVSGGSDNDKANVLSEVGYKIGTAYQLADDLIDVLGNEAKTGKTLGTDRKRRKFTLAQSDDLSSEALIRDQVTLLCNSALELTLKWPELTSRLEDYINHELFPFWELNLSVMDASLYEV